MDHSDRTEILINNGLDWYLVDYDDDTTKLMHSSGLSSILQCGQDPADFGIAEMTQCWNGYDLSD